MKRKGHLSKKLYKKLKTEELKSKKEREEIVKSLLSVCLWGGDLSQIKELLLKHQYTKNELEKAISTLSLHASSAIESMLASKAIKYIEDYIKEKKIKN
jgi:DNA topoisomerase VI subunit A